MGLPPILPSIPNHCETRNALFWTPFFFNGPPNRQCDSAANAVAAKRKILKRTKKGAGACFFLEGTNTYRAAHKMNATRMKSQANRSSEITTPKCERSLEERGEEVIALHLRAPGAACESHRSAVLLPFAPHAVLRSVRFHPTFASNGIKSHRTKSSACATFFFF